MLEKQNSSEKAQMDVRIDKTPALAAETMVRKVR
jgi:hypothetical protein